VVHDVDPVGGADEEGGGVGQGRDALPLSCARTYETKNTLNDDIYTKVII
jgi:hypothetical protein